MTESVIKRVKRIISGKIEDNIVAMERAGGTSVMRQAIRETERAMEDVKIERDEATGRRLQAVRQQKLYQDRLDALTQKAEFALNEGREDLARAALTRQVEFEEQIVRLDEAEAKAAAQEREWQESYAQLEMRAAHMQEELDGFEQTQAEMSMESTSANTVKHSAGRKTDRAEAAFSRAMQGAGGVSGVTAGDIQTTRSLAEIENMQRDQLINDRLDALRLKKAV